jgi:hypothetical protein
MKRGMLRKAIDIMVAALGLISVESAVAGDYTATGTIYALVIQDSSWGANADYVLVNGATSLGTCGKQNGFVVLQLTDDAKGQRQFAFLLAAKTAETPVTVGVTDTFLSSQGLCILRHVY